MVGMDKNIEHIKADQLFAWFEQNKFVNSGVYPRNTNLVFAFADFIDSLSDDKLLEILNFDNDILVNNKTEASQIEVEHFRSIVKEGIDSWLRYNAKTMAII